MTFAVRIGVSNSRDRVPEWVDALVETGATFTVLPASPLRERVRVTPTRQLTFTFADGRERPIPVGEAR